MREQRRLISTEDMMKTNSDKGSSALMQCVSSDGGQPNVSILLAQRVLTLFEESGTTPQEQNTALDILRSIVLDRLLSPSTLLAHPSS